MIARFGNPVPVLCMINNYMIDYIYQAHSHRILQWNDSILQSKLKENIPGRCLSTGATKFFKIVLADKEFTLHFLLTFLSNGVGLDVSV